MAGELELVPRPTLMDFPVQTLSTHEAFVPELGCAHSPSAVLVWAKVF